MTPNFLEKLKRGISYDPLIWKRGWRFKYHWIRPAGYGFFRVKIGIREFMPHPGAYLIVKFGEKQHSFSIGATFKYSEALLNRAEIERKTPYQLAGRTESV